MNDDDNFEQLVLANKREWNGFWFWRDKPVGERGAARNILEAAGVQVDGLRSLDRRPARLRSNVGRPIFWRRGNGASSPTHAGTIHQSGETAFAR